MLESLQVADLLALFVGLYMMAGGVGLLLDREGYSRLVDELVASPALTFLAALFAFMLGATILSLHHDWSTPIAIVVSLIGWGALVEGMLMLVFRRAFMGIVRAFPFNAATIIPFALFAVALGGWLVYAALN